MGQTQERAQWSGKLAFVLSAAASAVGLGSIWRFPYLAAQYGGGMFLFVYLIFIFTIGISLLLLEHALGRKTRLSSIGAFGSFGKKYKFIGVLAAIVPFIICPYYCVIGGWTTKYMFAYLFDGPAQLADGGQYFTSFISDPVQSVVFLLIFIAACCFIVGRGVNKGIERANLVMMPALIIFAAALGIYALTLPGAMDGLGFYLIPDISKFSPNLVIAALGQTFFTLSIAMGIMITYGSYIRDDEKLTSSVMQIAATTFGVALLAGLMIIPATFATFGSGEAVANNAGPSLMYIILPQVFASMEGAGNIIGFVFFILVIFAALTSAISVFEVCVSVCMDQLRFSRARALAYVGTYVVVFGIIVALGYSSLDFIAPLGEGSSILDFADFLSNSVLMPIVAILTCVFIGWIAGPKVIIEEVRKNVEFKLAGAWTIMIKYIAPIAIVVILVAYVAQTFGFIKL